MHLVTPKVWLISMPSIDFDAMREYLEDVEFMVPLNEEHES